MLAAEKPGATFIAPVGIGLSLFIAELMGVYYTGGSLNPARSFGPCVVLRTFSSYHWIYWVGPVLGALLASGFYMFIKALEYETVNPEQDGEGNEGRAFDPHSGAERKVDPSRIHGAGHHRGHGYSSRKSDRSDSTDAKTVPDKLHGGRLSDDTAIDSRNRASGPIARRERDLDLETGIGSPLP